MSGGGPGSHCRQADNPPWYTYRRSVASYTMALLNSRWATCLLCLLHAMQTAASTIDQTAEATDEVGHSIARTPPSHHLSGHTMYAHPLSQRTPPQKQAKILNLKKAKAKLLARRQHESNPHSPSLVECHVECHWAELAAADSAQEKVRPLGPHPAAPYHTAPHHTEPPPIGPHCTPRCTPYCTPNLTPNPTHTRPHSN